MDKLDGQMSIFDLMQEDLENMDEEYMVERVSLATGINFKYSDEIFGYTAKVGKTDFDVKFSRFNMSDNKNRFIMCGWTDREDGYNGQGRPCESLDDAILFFRKKLGK